MKESIFIAVTACTKDLAIHENGHRVMIIAAIDLWSVPHITWSGSGRLYRGGASSIGDAIGLLWISV